MLANVKTVDPWMQTIGLLSGAVNAWRNEAVFDRAVPVAKAPARVAVKVIDRPTPTTATIEWRESTRCSYGDQLWRAARARVAGVCAMSGKAIARGDSVYRPSNRPLPRNAEAMILASVLEAAAPL
ncbi:DUF3331 domain-containing protein [Trinickia caryophylli]|uniref:DUF3331 domain-containing protein n=1 Tax=Trinickia caryophylli TaxID=28094 RepID=A0A1X7GJF2_TRICW|nr:DUF3331 domain-containing protein [Trinickia caryophylli]PMS09945.1 DUF3331 domain-containing protein [Trinickia caryophylli]TRX14946.1 DUF3331 domain-containing protein [Trinickia caryophylli]WQE14802.1 DUF3331 domain-containing protein [Trinickia caryophylli]SMF70676.1 protein of unknown function [Trinickia caryophylli]